VSPEEKRPQLARHRRREKKREGGGSSISIQKEKEEKKKRRDRCSVQRKEKKEVVLHTCRPCEKGRGKKRERSQMAYSVALFEAHHFRLRKKRGEMSYRVLAERKRRKREGGGRLAPMKPADSSFAVEASVSLRSPCQGKR